MEWVETTAKTVDDAKNAALDQLGVAADEAEFEVVEEPRQGLFGRTRGEARVRARVKPAQVRQKNERRRKPARDRSKPKADKRDNGSNDESTPSTSSNDEVASTEAADAPAEQREQPKNRKGGGAKGGQRRNNGSRDNNQERKMNDENETTVEPQEVGDAAVAFMDGLVSAFGAESTCELTIDGTELDVAVTGEGLGLLVGPGGRTLNAIQDLARVSAQRRLGDHETRLRIDVAGYRVRRSEALTRFALDVASQVRESGEPRSLEPMSSADRKVIHDALNEEEGVGSRSEGDDPNRRIVIVPA
ncbi:RNA-binding cell elongation regulator Jag/EloR [Ilumatobacter coccineus]|jgi:spoIIIJ-associated protein|uniref:RNA-binding protein KhpB n=1 Tax=Ilumatobacter coccineus (strain NBRC 103263 / KCTC 29153 / YM16-304) TaxID=1313172 RepID=A0A6C7EDQ7_ILUCY|nr:RNA-binding cell elongation regulator Jag/EloR [Ilumatobacter coccineus]BAN04601.1 hypothetical protein YM304_42870 [Ilumatobacter coccineus YM16-304]